MGHLCISNFFHFSDICFFFVVAPIIPVLRAGNLPPSPFSATNGLLTLHLLEEAFLWWDPGAAGSLGVCWNKRKHFGHLLAPDSEQFPSLKSKVSWVEALLPPDPPRQTSPFLFLEAQGLQVHLIKTNGEF